LVRNKNGKANTNILQGEPAMVLSGGKLSDGNGGWLQAAGFKLRF